MATLDWVFVVVLLASVALGAWRGLVYEVVSVLGWIAAFILAQWFAPDVAERLPMGKAAEQVRYAAGFVVVFVAAAFAGGLVAWLTKKAIEAMGLRPVDRTLGGAFGLVRGVVLLLAAAVVMEMTQLRTSDGWQESKGAAVLTVALKGLKPVLPEQFGKYLP
ncbi:MAG: CvpA family protein [Comamonadaceae bacterium]|nr:MAG: CvpA family protein [Comamonadaceae bacterium]